MSVSARCHVTHTFMESMRVYIELVECMRMVTIPGLTTSWYNLTCSITRAYYRLPVISGVTRQLALSY